MKKIIRIILSLLSLFFLLAGCKSEEVEHEHTFSDYLSCDENYHWYDCTECDSVAGKEEHDWYASPLQQLDCGGGYGELFFKCRICGFHKTELYYDERLHCYSDEFIQDEKYHWYKCEYCDSVTGKEKHTWIVTMDEWGFGSKIPAGCLEDGEQSVICDVCNYWTIEVIPAPGIEHSLVSMIGIDKCSACDKAFYKGEGFVKVPGVVITGSEDWNPTSEIFVKDRAITISDLIVCDHEVTRGEYKAIIGNLPDMGAAYDKNGNRLKGDAALNNPVRSVKWYDALVYCNKLSLKEGLTPCYTIYGTTNPDEWWDVPGYMYDVWDDALCNFDADGYRLPTEAEWEWLARGGQNYQFAGSDNLTDVAWYGFQQFEDGCGTRDVRTKNPNGYGLYDMTGNVSEFCWDWFGDINSTTVFDGSHSGKDRSRRGGCYDRDYHDCKINLRNKVDPDNNPFSCGFRVVRTVK